MAHTMAQHTALATLAAAKRAEVEYAGRDGGELMRLERVTREAREAARRIGLAIGD